jgi:putative nucleotidyltransferase with HDIG domain
VSESAALEEPEFSASDLLRGDSLLPVEEADPIDDGELQLLVQLTTQHFRQNLPEPASFPGLALKAVELVARPDVELRQLASLVAQDPALSARVLRVANSASYARSTKAENVLGAITRLGLNEAASIISGSATQALYDPTAKAEYRLFKDRWNLLFHHSMTAAIAAGQLATALRRGDPSRAFMGGMFHDIGKSIALRSVCHLVLSGKTRLDPADRAIDRLLDAVHVEVGVELHRLWKVPLWMSQLCLLHHSDQLPSGEGADDLNIVRLVSGIALFRFDPGLNVRYANQILDSLRALKLRRQDLSALKREIEKHAKRVAAGFEIADPADAVASRGGGGPASEA